MYKYLFGPVPSRRLGMSLGLDLVPKKVCSLNCIYCEVGLTTNLTTERREYIAIAKLTTELEHYFSCNPKPDYITFSGAGEPTLNSRIGDVIDFIKRKQPDIPIAVLTNGTLLSDPKVREELLATDVVLPSLDAATEETFQRINHPASNITLDKYIIGLIEFRKSFTGKIWLEVFIAPGYNDNKNDLIALKNAILKIKPDRIQLNTLDRPDTNKSLSSASIKVLKKYLITGI